ncbi:hypothetical protein EV199_3031 [Pseudobacter ginsenosidimutans]|uniref:Uncharacterized protein n=2 Tax=Pseudobacter ginsenosidimutans TaxID=661488 RepID=A0A4Q7MVM9_9BACT|nr:hypothetical protein EV199_3031 [Pseudobacter ginsenosidimutans]
MIVAIFGSMKAFAALLLLVVLSTNTNGQTVSTQTHVDFGYVDSSWTFKSAGLGVKFPIPKGWYFMNGATNPPSYVKVGSKLVHIMGYNKPMRVPIADFNRIHNNSIAILFAFSQLPDSGIVIRKPLDYNADKTFSFGITTATDTSTYAFLRYTCLRCTDESFKEIYTGEVKIGNTIFDGYITGVTDKKGNKMGHFIGVKRISNHYLVLQFNFPGPETFDSYKEFLKDLQVK